jgi:hypothetical protein
MTLNFSWHVIWSVIMSEEGREIQWLRHLSNTGSYTYTHTWSIRLTSQITIELDLFTLHSIALQILHMAWTLGERLRLHFILCMQQTKSKRYKVRLSHTGSIQFEFLCLCLCLGLDISFSIYPLSIFDEWKRRSISLCTIMYSWEIRWKMDSRLGHRNRMHYALNLCKLGIQEVQWICKYYE